jgi:hypothetical protein
VCGAGEIRVGADDETGGGDAGGDAGGRAREGECLVGAAGEGERGGTRGARWVEDEGADRGGVVAVENLGDGRAREVGTGEGVNLRRGQSSSYRVVGRRDGVGVAGPRRRSNRWLRPSCLVRCSVGGAGWVMSIASIGCRLILLSRTCQGRVVIAGRRERFGLRALPRARAGRAADCPSRFGRGVRPQRRLGALHGQERSGVRADLGRPMNSAAVDITQSTEGAISSSMVRRWRAHGRRSGRATANSPTC